jgi:high frequency lysogenization protein
MTQPEGNGSSAGAPPPSPSTSASGGASRSGIALAGVTLAALLVDRTANGKPVDDRTRHALLRSVTTHRATRMEEIVPDTAFLREGARSAMDSLSGRTRSPDVVRYALQLIELAHLLKQVPQIVEKLGRLLDALDPELASDAELAKVYRETISTLGKRIQVSGNPEILQQEATADQIRALLLAGVRMAWLWEQSGGRRWHLLLRRGAINATLAPLAS